MTLVEMARDDVAGAASLRSRAKLVEQTPGGLEARHAYRRTDAWADHGLSLGKGGYWLGDGDGPVRGAGRSRQKLDAVLGVARVVEERLSAALAGRAA